MLAGSTGLMLWAVQVPVVTQPLLRSGLTGVLRYANCYLGGIMWMAYASNLGLQ